MEKLYTIAIALFLISFQLKAEDIQLSYRGGVYHTPVTLNNSVRLEFIVDTGASSVLIPDDVFKTLLRTRTISKSDFLGSSKAETASGEIIDIFKINIRELKVGSRTIQNVEASIGDDNASLLLGQSALQKLEPWKLQSSKRILTINSNTTNAHEPLGNFVPDKITREEILVFLDKYISRGNSRDLDGVLSLYSDYVDYFSVNNVSRDYIYEDKAKYYERWPSSQTKFGKLIDVQHSSKGQETLVTFSIYFDVYNYLKQKGIKGEAQNEVILSKENGKIKIVRDKQKVLSRIKY